MDYAVAVIFLAVTAWILGVARARLESMAPWAGLGVVAAVLLAANVAFGLLIRQDPGTFSGDSLAAALLALGCTWQAQVWLRRLPSGAWSTGLSIAGVLIFVLAVAWLVVSAALSLV